MNIKEIIRRLEKIAEHAVHTPGETPFVMSLDDGIALHEAVELLRTRIVPDACNSCNRRAGCKDGTDLSTQNCSMKILR